MTLQTPLRRGSALLLAALLTVVLAACGGGDSDGDGTGGGTATVENGAVTISSENLEFDVATIEAPADEAFTITYNNNEGQPHNVAILVEEGGDEIVVSDVITGPDATQDIEVPALDAGTYYFFCEIHPDMEGTIVVS